MSMKPVLHSFAYGLDFLRLQVANVSEADLVAQPEGIANHPTWVMGHLTFSCQMIGGVIGVAEWLPEGFGGRFGPGSAPVSDLGAYEPKQTALERLRDAQWRITQAVEAMNDAQLDRPFPDPSYLDVFPTVGHALTQVLVGHLGYHVGEVTVWRRAMGLPRLERSFE